MECLHESPITEVMFSRETFYPHYKLGLLYVAPLLPVSYIESCVYTEITDHRNSGTMGTRHYLLTLFVAFSCGQSPPSDPAEGSAPIRGTDTTAESPIARSGAAHRLRNMEDIRKEYSHVTSEVESNGMVSDFFIYNCHGEKKGKVMYFSDEAGLRLIRHTYDEYSHFSATDEYFVKDGFLFFVLFDHVSWSFEGEGETRDDVTEKRFYIIEAQALKCLEKKFTVRSPSSADTRRQRAANKETDCSSLEAVLNKFELLSSYRSREKDPDCLEE